MPRVLSVPVPGIWGFAAGKVASPHGGFFETHNMVEIGACYGFQKPTPHNEKTGSPPKAMVLGEAAGQPLLFCRRVLDP